MGRRGNGIAPVCISRKNSFMPNGSLPLGCTSTIEPGWGLGPSASQLSAPSATRCRLRTVFEQRGVGDKTWKAEKNRRRLAFGDDELFRLEYLAINIHARRRR